MNTATRAWERLRPLSPWCIAVAALITAGDMLLGDHRYTPTIFLAAMAVRYAITMALAALWVGATLWWETRNGTPNRDPGPEQDPPQDAPGPAGDRKPWVAGALGFTALGASAAWANWVSGQIAEPGDLVVRTTFILGATSALITLRLVWMVPARDYSPLWLTLLSGLMLANFIVMDRAGNAALESGMETLRELQVVTALLTGLPAMAIMVSRSLRKLQDCRRGNRP